VRVADTVEKPEFPVTVRQPCCIPWQKFSWKEPAFQSD
jgi:hypothetical protein